MDRITRGIFLSVVAAQMLCGAPGTPASCSGNLVSSAANDGNDTLRACIDKAADGSTITFASDMTITLASQLTIDKNLTIDGGTHQIVLDGNNSTRVLFIYDSTVSLSRLTVQDGNESSGYFGGGIYQSGGRLTLDHLTISGNHTQMGGGGIASVDGSLTITHSTISGNTVEEYGGGVYLYNESGEVLIRDSNITGNTNTGSGAGGVYIWYSDTPVTIADCTISSNKGGSGGGIGGSDMSTLHITNATISGNNATEKGGGIYVDSRDDNITIANATISGNNATENGGGIWMFGNDSNMTLANVTISDNNATENGGGIWMKGSDSNMTLTHATISNNTAESGSGGIGMLSDNSNMTLTNTTISGNTGNGAGGGIWMYGSDSNMTLTNATISDNNATGNGGGIYNEQTSLKIVHTTITRNIAASGSGIYDSGSSTTVNNTIIAGNTNDDFVNIVSSDYNLLGSGILSNAQQAHDMSNVTDPKLAPLSDNGGNTLTCMPLHGSPAIRKGTVAGLPKDQTGAARTNPATIGSVEYKTVPIISIITYLIL